MIKKYWAIIVGAILAIFGIAVATKKKVDDKQNAKAAKKIDDNNQQVDIITGKVDVIEDQRNATKEEVKDLIAEVETLIETKDEVVVEKPKSTKQTKQNILNKTNKKRKK
jgi:hydroxyethylthiazole kinase-like sugar kinase family protein